MEKLLILSLLTINVVYGQSSTLIEPTGTNGIFSKNATTVSNSSIVVAVPVSGAGTRLMWIPAQSAFRVGTVVGSEWNAANIGTWSFASGRNTLASGPTSTSMGFATTASGAASTSMGSNTTANGDYSISMGSTTTASGDYSTSMGFATTASGDYSTSMGSNTTAQASHSVVIGRLNIISGTTNNWVNTEPLFVVGNGTSGSERNNALTLLKNGKLGLGVANPDQLLDVNGRARIRHNGISAGIWMCNSLNGLSIADGAFYGMRTDTEAGIWVGGNWRFYVNNVGNGTFTGCVTASNISCPSDFRYKKNIKAIENPLSSILKIEGVRYDWRKEEFPDRNFSDKNQIGFIAQEIEKIFPEMVFTDEIGYKSVDYARMTPVLIEAMKEQQRMIDELKIMNDGLKIRNKNLESRLDKIEAILRK